MAGLDRFLRAAIRSAYRRATDARNGRWLIEGGK